MPVKIIYSLGALSVFLIALCFIHCVRTGANPVFMWTMYGGLCLG